MAYPWHKSELSKLLLHKAQLPHAMLLVGTQGIGKLAFAEALAQSLLCESPQTEGSACGLCSACGWMGQGSHPDFRRLEPDSLSEAGETEQGSEKREKASSHIPVELVRSIADFINISSHRGGVKVVLIHPAESLNANAANALLKNLEEPPPRTHFLLVSHRWHRLLPTIKSRCRLVPLPPPAPEAARDWLKQQGLREPDLALAQAGGAPLLAAAYDEDYWQQRREFLKAISGGKIDALAIAEQIRDQEPARIVGWLQKWSYDLVCHQATGEVRYNPDFEAALSAAAGRIGAIEAARFARHMVSMQRIVSHPLNTRLLFEEVLLTYAELARQRPLGRAA